MVPYTNSKSHFLEKRGTTPKVVPNTNLALKSFKPQPPRSFLLDKSKNTQTLLQQIIYFNTFLKVCQACRVMFIAI